MGKNTSPALEALALALAEKVKLSAGRPKPRLRVITAAKPMMFDAITRDSVLRRIRYLARAYQLQWLVDQETFNAPGVDSLENHELSALLRVMEQGRECQEEGVSFEDAGLIQSTASRLPAEF